MDESLQTSATALFEEALAAAGTRDPREFYRERLRELKSANPEGYALAVAYFQGELIPSIAAGASEPITAWQAYGIRLAEWTRPGGPVEIDESGRAHAHDPPTAASRLILHLPEGKGRAIVVGLPSTLTAAQRATFDLLVAGKQKLKEEAHG